MTTLKFMSFRLWPLLALGMLWGCQAEPRFTLLDEKLTGVSFSNRLTETAQINIFTYLYFYNGGGVAIGDVNNDGMPDLYFTANQDSNRLYLNRGDFRFEDVTVQSGALGSLGWTNGVTMADVNHDGLLDIYVSQLGDYKTIIGRNQLFINKGVDGKGIPQFVDEAADWNLDLIGFSTQAAFFDYDLDGDLDMYMLNHSVHSNGTFGRSDIRKEVHPLAGDKLLRNEGNHFVDVTQRAGIYSSALGYGLGISTGDINGDGWPDVYIGNDFHEDDYLYINNGNGTFTEGLASAMPHTSRFSMGNDLGDINNDGLLDILSLDMHPDEPVRLKSSAGEDSYDVYSMKLGFGYKDQFARNTLQLNRGNGKFSDIGVMAGIYATDWSWGSLFADLDLDGKTDIYISNGIKRRSNDNDYISYISNDVIQGRLEGDIGDEDLRLVEKMPVIKIPNYAYRNVDGYRFTDVSDEWGLNQASFSNGSAYGDLDGDGDLDLVVNNVDQKAFIYRNNTISPGKESESSYLKLTFRGDSLNTFGIGTRVLIPTDTGCLIRELYSTRGYLSSVNPELIFGLGGAKVVDSLIVIWPDKRYQVLTNVKTNQSLTVKKGEANGFFKFVQPVIQKSNLADSLGLSFRHKENSFSEFNREFLVPHMASAEGPPVAIGDINRDGADDVFIGNAKHKQGGIWIQEKGRFVSVKTPSIQYDSLAEDTDATFLDVDLDGDLDLIVMSGGNEFRGESPQLQPRLYRNANGEFTRDPQAFADLHLQGAGVRPHDFDKDGDPDLLMLGRIVAWKYGTPADSYLLENDGRGNFKNVTPDLAPELLSLGMVNDAKWGDFNGDGASDIVLVGDWMPITLFYFEGGKFRKVIPDGLNYSHGWWNCVTVLDVDGDGDQDWVAGNLGLNSKLTASVKQPVSAFVNDFDDNGSSEPLIYYWFKGKEILLPTRDEITKQIVSLKRKYPMYIDYANAEPKSIFPRTKFDQALKLVAYEFRSGVFLNLGKSEFSFRPFPGEAQFSAIMAIQPLHFDGDGKMDLFLAGNFLESNIQLGKYDADYGTLLRSEGGGQWSVVPNKVTGLYINGEVRNIEPIRINGHQYFIFGRNNNQVYVTKLEP